MPSGQHQHQHLILEAPSATRRHHGRRHRLKTVATFTGRSPQTNVATGPRHPQAAWDRLDGAVPTERQQGLPARYAEGVHGILPDLAPGGVLEPSPPRHREMMAFSATTMLAQDPDMMLAVLTPIKSSNPPTRFKVMATAYAAVEREPKPC